MVFLDALFKGFVLTVYAGIALSVLGFLGIVIWPGLVLNASNLLVLYLFGVFVVLTTTL